MRSYWRSLIGLRAGQVAMAGALLGGVISTTPSCAADTQAQPASVSVPMPTDGAPFSTAPAPSPSAIAPQILPPEEVDAEFLRLRQAFNREVPHHLALTTAQKANLIDLARGIATEGNLSIDHPQLVVVVDRNPRIQQLAVMLARPDGSWDVVGATHVSTGQPNRKLYYITPVGVFMHNGDILDYRAEGTFNENHIRGLGLKGSRVWDFGWQWATKGWRSDGEQGQIRLEMHATDPDYLEQRLGHPASEGCVRIPAALNHFMDRYGILDADYEHVAQDDRRYRAVLLPDRTPTPLAGHALVVVDSATKS